MYLTYSYYCHFCPLSPCFHPCQPPLFLLVTFPYSCLLFFWLPHPIPKFNPVLPWVWNYSVESGGLTSGYILKILIPPTTHNLSKSISSTVGGREPQILPHPWLLLTGLILFQATSVAVGSRSQWLCLLSTMPALVCTLTSSVWQLPFFCHLLASLCYFLSLEGS